MNPGLSSMGWVRWIIDRIRAWRGAHPGAGRRARRVFWDLPE